MAEPTDDRSRAVAAGDAEAVAREVLALAPAGRTAAIARLATAGDVAALAALDASAVPRDVRKEARRALHLLRARGGAPPPPVPRAAGVPAPVPDPRATEPAGYLGLEPPDALLVLETHPGGRHAVAVVVVDSRERVIGGVLLADASRRQVREIRVQYVEEGKVPVAIAPPGHVLERIRAALRRPPSTAGDSAAEARADLAMRLPDLAGGIEPAEHPALGLAPDGLDAIASEARRLFERIDGSDLPVVLERGPNERLVGRLEAASRGPLVLSPAQVAEREGEVFRAFATDGLGDDERAGLVARLLDRAWILHRRDREADARGWASAGALLHRFRADPRAIDLTVAWLRFHVRRAAFDEAGRERPESPKPRSDIGLILPGTEGGGGEGGGGLILP